jgi:hypothetical protein
MVELLIEYFCASTIAGLVTVWFTHEGSEAASFPRDFSGMISQSGRSVATLHSYLPLKHFSPSYLNAG